MNYSFVRRWLATLEGQAAGDVRYGNPKRVSNLAESLRISGGNSVWVGVLRGTGMDPDQGV